MNSKGAVGRALDVSLPAAAQEQKVVCSKGVEPVIGIIYAVKYRRQTGKSRFLHKRQRTEVLTFAIYAARVRQVALINCN